MSAIITVAPTGPIQRQQVGPGIISGFATYSATSGPVPALDRIDGVKAEPFINGSTRLGCGQPDCARPGLQKGRQDFPHESAADPLAPQILADDEIADPAARPVFYGSDEGNRRIVHPHGQTPLRKTAQEEIELPSAADPILFSGKGEKNRQVSMSKPVDYHVLV